MRKLRIAFSDLWTGFNFRDNRIWNALKGHYQLELTSDLSAADLLVFGDFGITHWGYKGRKIYLTGENMLPDFDQCDLAFTPAEIIGDERAVRLPLYAHRPNELHALIRPPGYDASIQLNKNGFCSFVVSNPNCRMRNKVFKSIHRRRLVDSGGSHFNTTGTPIINKSQFIEKFRFNIACENSSSPGYITEKLVDPIFVGAIPIYWGAPDVNRDFNPGCMINVSDYMHPNDLVEYVLRVAEDDNARLNILQAPVFLNNQLPKCLKDEFVSIPILNLIENRTAGSRRLRHRRIREHIKSSQSILAYKFDKLLYTIESRLWKLGLHK